jgi:hypothetical protein
VGSHSSPGDFGEEQGQSATHLAPVLSLKLGDVFFPNHQLSPALAPRSFKFELVVNLKTAKAISPKIPEPLLCAWAKVIE